MFLKNMFYIPVSFRAEVISTCELLFLIQVCWELFNAQGLFVLLGNLRKHFAPWFIVNKLACTFSKQLFNH